MGTRFLSGTLLAASLVGLASPAAAVDLHEGIRAGVSIGELGTEPSSDGQVDMTAIPGLTGGGFVTVGIGRWLAVQPEINVIQKGAVLGYRTATGEWVKDDRLNTTYLELPLLLRVSIAPDARATPYFAAGPYLAFLVQASVERSEPGESGDVESTHDVTPETNGTDLGVLAAAGLAIRAGDGHLLVEARFAYGGPNVSDEFDSGNRAYVLTLGYAWDD